MLLGDGRDQLAAKAQRADTAETVGEAFQPDMQSILTEIYVRHAWSSQAIEGGDDPAGGGGRGEGRGWRGLLLAPRS